MPFALTGELFLQLVLNLERVEMRGAVAVARGMSATSPDPLGSEWADAVASDASEVEPILSEANSARAIARGRMKR